MNLGEIVNRVAHLSRCAETAYIQRKALSSTHPIKDVRPTKEEVVDNINYRRWTLVLIALWVVLLSVYLMATLLIDSVINPILPLPNTDKLYDEFEDPINDIKESFVPRVQDWFIGRQQKPKDKRVHVTSHLLGVDRERQTPANLTCLDAFVDELKDMQPRTDPSYANLVLQSLGDDLYSSPTIRSALHELLTEPQDLNGMYDDSYSCMRDNQPLVAMACTATEHNILPDLSKGETKIIFRYIVTFAAVLDRLTLHMESNLQDFYHMTQTMLYSRRKEIEAHYHSTFGEQKDLLEFLLAKYRGVALASKELLNSKAQNGINDPIRDASLQLNIIEAIKRDIDLDHIGNAEVGLAIAASVHTGRYSESNHVFDQLGKDWVDAYIAWNLQFMITSLNSFAYLTLGKLLVPSIVCSSTEQGRFFERRVISLSISLMHSLDPNVHSNSTMTSHTVPQSDMVVFQRFKKTSNPIYQAYNKEAISRFVNDMEKSNKKNMLIPDPSEDTILEMLYKLCGETCHGSVQQSLTSILIDDDGHFTIYVGFINWITVVITGLGWEMFMMLFHLKEGWTKTHETQYMAAEFLFSILSLITLGLGTSRNYLSLFTLVAGCWKLGFPETIATMYCAFYDTSLSPKKRISLALDSIGYLLHHSAASLVICMALTGNIILDRYVVDILLILCIQHWFVLLARRNKMIYIVIELILEVWYQWTHWANFHQFAYNHWTAQVASLAMWSAHIIWMISSLLDMFSNSSLRKVSKTPTSDGDRDGRTEDTWVDDERV